MSGLSAACKPSPWHREGPFLKLGLLSRAAPGLHTHRKESMVSATFRLRAGHGVTLQSAEDKAESNDSKQT